MNQAFIQSTKPSGQIFPLGELSTLGSSNYCQISIPNSGVSDRHARIEKKGEQYVFRDLRSEFGSYLNDTRIIEALLTDGDHIKMGDEEFIFSLNEPSKTPNFDMTSRNPFWKEELERISKAAHTEFPLLLLGPSGSGKDILAQKIHAASSRAEGPMISFNCSAIAETLVESELFGHTKGSFTGAISDRKGAFEAARGGTLFLDEIGDLSYGLQAKLLRALENSEIRPVGSDDVVKTNVRIIAATHQNLVEKIQKNLFRSDLYYRLNVVTIHTPSLVERMEDFEDLLYQFARHHRVRFSHLAIQRLKMHSWPGNIRELKNLVARASALYPKDNVDENKVEKLIDRNWMYEKPIALNHSENQNENDMSIIKEIEKQMILRRMEANQGNQRRTALDLKMPKSTLHDRLKHYNINPEDYKKSASN